MPLRSPRLIACQDRIVPLLCSVLSWYKIPYQGTCILILMGQQKSSSCRGGQLLKAGGFMTLGQHVLFVYLSSCHTQVKTVPIEPSCLLYYFTISTYFLFCLHVAQKCSSCPHGERLTPHFTSNCPKFPFPNFFSLLLHVPSQLLREAVKRKMLFSFQKAAEINVFLCLYY